MLDFLIFAVTFICVLILTIVYLYPSTRRETTVPGANPSDEKLGNFGDIDKAGGIHYYLTQLHEEHGPIVSLWWGQHLAISVASPQLFKELQTAFDRPHVIFDAFKNVFGDNTLQFMNGAEGRRFHTALKKPFSFAAMSNYTDTLYKISDELHSKLQSHTPTDHLPLMQTMFSVAIKAISVVSFGLYFANNDRVTELWRAYDSMVKHWESMAHSDNDETAKKFEKDKEVIFTTIRNAIESHKSSSADAAQGSTQCRIFVDELLDLCDTQEQAVSNAVMFFVAGFHTTGLLLTWSLYFLAIHPQAQEDAYNEIIDVLGDELVTRQTSSKLKYCSQVMNEAMRCSCLATYAGRCLDFDIELAGHKIKAGTPIILALGALQHNPDVWEDPTRFDPERFSESAVKSRHPNSFHPFGLGKRICPGYILSLFEAHVILSSLIRSYKIHLVERQVVTPQYGFVTKPAEEIWVTFEKRS